MQCAGIAELNANDAVNQRMRDDVRKSHEALTARLRTLLAERDALKDALDSYIGFVDEAHIIEGQFHWLPSGSSQDIIDAARNGEA